SSFNHVSPEFFTVFDIPISEGRNFSPDEAASGAAVAIVSQTLARNLWPNQDAVGQSIRLIRDPRANRQAKLRFNTAEVIGVSRDILTGVTDSDSQRSCVYFPVTVNPSGIPALLVRVNGDLEAARQKLDADLNAADPGSVDYIHKMQEFVAGRNYPFQVAYWV